MSWEAFRGEGVTHQASKVESDRFGLAVGRVTVGSQISEEAAADALCRVVTRAEEDLLIVRWPSRFARLGAAIIGCGRVIIPADVLMYWEMPSSGLVPDPVGLRNGGLSTVIPGVRGSIIEALVPVIRDSFRDYSNHYAANPALDRDLALLGYLDWVHRTILEGPGNVVVLMQAERPVGFATLSASPDRDRLEVLLAGLTPEAQGRGWYRHLLAAVSELAAAGGFGSVLISTQAHNTRAQRAWAGIGFRPFAAITTVHATKPGSS